MSPHFTHRFLSPHVVHQKFCRTFFLIQLKTGFFVPWSQKFRLADNLNGKTGFCGVKRKKREKLELSPDHSSRSSCGLNPGSTQEEEGPGFSPLQMAQTSVSPLQCALLPVYRPGGVSPGTCSHLAVSLCDINWMLSGLPNA